MKTFVIIFILFATEGIAPAAEAPGPPLPDQSPVAEFRQWLKMEPTDRTAELATRPPQNRKILEEKLREYASLSEEERDRRLNAIELRWYLRTLIESPANLRGNKVEKSPEALRKIIKERLALWDKIPADVQKRILENELTIRYLSGPAPEQAAVLQTLNPEEKNQLEARVVQWKALSQAEQTGVRDYLQDFFDLPKEKQQRVLVSFKPQDREEMSKTLSVFRQLPPKERADCINAFGRFASMPHDERMAFLHNVDRWQAMSQTDRDAWRNVAKELPSMPPLPPGLFGLPPLPPGAERR